MSGTEDMIRRAIADPGEFTKRVVDPHCDTQNCTCEAVPAWCARAVGIALAAEPALRTALTEIAQWIEEDAASEDEEIANYAAGIARRIRDRTEGETG